MLFDSFWQKIDLKQIKKNKNNKKRLPAKPPMATNKPGQVETRRAAKGSSQGGFGGEAFFIFLFFLFFLIFLNRFSAKTYEKALEGSHLFKKTSPFLLSVETPKPSKMQRFGVSSE